VSPSPQANEPKLLDFSVVGEPLVKLLIATGNKLSREWPAKYSNIAGARELFVMHLRVAHLTYRSALYLGGDIPADERRLPEIITSKVQMKALSWRIPTPHPSVRRK
jgi:hypothetical protein